MGSKVEIELNADQEECIVSLINSIISKSPHLQLLNCDPLVFMRLVSVISLIETTLCTKYQILLKRNSTTHQSIQLIKSWLKQYYRHDFVDSLCQTSHSNNDQIIGNDDQNNVEKNAENNAENSDNIKTDTDITSNDNNDDYSSQINNKDIALISLMILSIAHKLRISLPRINAYFDPDWQKLSQFDHILHEVTNCDKLLEIVQNELCIKRKQLEVTRSKVMQLQSTLNNKLLQVHKEKKTKLDYHSNLFAEYEDNGDSGGKHLVYLDASDEVLTDDSNASEVYVDHASDDDYVPSHKMQKMSPKVSKSSPKRSSKKMPNSQKSYRGRGRPPRDALNPIRIMPTVKSSSKGRGRRPKAEAIQSVDGDSETMGTNSEPFECELCGKTFAKEYRLTRHTFTHTGHKQFQCDYPDCGESFDLKWKLSAHKQEHCGLGGNDDDDGYGNQLFQCEWADCGESFSSKRELTVHEHEQHANRSTSKYSCDWPQCKEIFENKIDWRKHVKTHGKIVPTECGFPGCHKSFYKLDSLENHRKVHETFSLNELS